MRVIAAAALGHPALGAEIRRRVGRAPLAPNVVRDSVVATFIDFNLRHERTRDTYVRQLGESVVRGQFSESDRLDFLSELAWYMLERGLANIATDRLPRRLARQFGLDVEAMRLDVKSQLVLEQVQDERDTPTTALGFSIPLQPGANIAAVDESLTGALFVAEFLASRLHEALTTPSLEIDYFFRFLGRAPLSEATALFLRHRMADKAVDHSVAALGTIRSRAIELMRSLAAAGGGCVFVASLRHLVPNLRRLGAIDHKEAETLDPWTEPIAASIESRGMVIVPAASPKSLRLRDFMSKRSGRLSPTGSRDGRATVPLAPFLLGVHEVTNAEYEQFVFSDEGKEWRVRRITRAGSTDGVPPSPFARDTNEYHLYFWQQTLGDGSYHPVPGSDDIPVSYVSWNAAAAYCDWLSGKARRGRVYGFFPDQYRPEERTESEPPGFRLPTLGEWLWAAYGTPLGGTAYDFAHPWDWIAPGVDRSDLPPSIQRRTDAMKETLLESGKLLAPVLDDELLDSGVSGLVGNVKEWIDEIEVELEGTPDLRARHVIAGATGYLGIDSFRFGYYVSLFSQNTNPDVGFRVARTLDADELRAIEAREEHLRTVTL